MNIFILFLNTYELAEASSILGCDKRFVPSVDAVSIIQKIIGHTCMSEDTRTVSFRLDAGNYGISYRAFFESRKETTEERETSFHVSFHDAARRV